MKRALDLLVSIVALILLSPLLLVVICAIYLKMGRPVFFVQERPGLGAKPFRMIKFRTMLNTQDASGRLLSDAERLTPFGAFLRSTSIDELPELVNVIGGEMSLVGPRPLLMEYIPLYSQEQYRRHEVRPGITGWAQINGRNAISWDEKFALDVWYVDNRSLWLDIKIFFLTFKRALLRDGIAHAGDATMPVFEGSRARNGSPKGGKE